MNKTLLITGAGGQLATEYELSKPVDGWDYIFVDFSKLNICDETQVDSYVKDVDAVLNLAAYTNVEKAEHDETELAFNANTLGPKILAISCNKKGIPLIHISTDYVFDGESDEPYTEKSLEAPINQYGATKFLGEKWIQENHDWYYIIRTAWVYSNHTKNFFTTMLTLSQERDDVSVVNDQFGSPTTTKELCRAIDKVLLNLDKLLSGVYHFSGLGQTSWKEFADEIFRQSKVNIEVNGVSSNTWPSKVKRPVNSYMSSGKFADTFGYMPMHWKNALKEIISERKTMPIKVGDVIVSDGAESIIVSTDWLKKLARIAPLNDMTNSIEVSFDSLQIYDKR